jgi:hypothetical protein
VSEEQDEEDHIILVDGHHPRVVEEDKDLVILEDVELPPAGSPMSNPTQTQLQYNHNPQPQDEGQIQTPLRQRSLSRNTLHRAVLIRSAQRAVLKAESAEREREEEEMEEMEVLGAVAADTGSEDESDDDVPIHHEADQRHTDEEENGDESDEDDEEEGEEEEEERRGRETSREPQKSVWRKSLERIWPFSSSSTGPHEETDDGDDEVVHLFFSRLRILLTILLICRLHRTLETVSYLMTTPSKKRKKKTRIVLLLFLHIPSPKHHYRLQSAEP